MTDVGTMRARYRRITAVRCAYLVQTWWFELFLPRIGLAGSRRATGQPGCSASRSASMCWRSTSAA